MVRTRVYVAFDFDDAAAKAELIRQGALPECPFQLEDCSILKPIDRGWATVAEQKIGSAECVIVLCGNQTHQAGGASTEVQIAEKLKKPMFFVAVSRKDTPTPPTHVAKGTPIYTWRWGTIKTLLEKGTPPADAVVRYS